MKILALLFNAAMVAVCVSTAVFGYKLFERADRTLTKLERDLEARRAPVTAPPKHVQA